MYEIIKKPDDFSWEDIYRLMYTAHAENRDKGLQINTAIQNGKQMKQHLGDNSETYVLKVDERIVGTVSVRIQKGTTRFIEDEPIALLMHLAILNKYRGQGYSRLLCDQVEQYARQHDALAIGLYVVDKNRAKEVYTHYGFESINFIPRENTKQNTVFMVKWLKPCYTPKWVRWTYFNAKKNYSLLRFHYR